MPFSVFRRHQRKLLAIFAIMAMFSFVLSDSLPSWIGGRSGSGAGIDPVIAKLSWKTYRASDLEPMRVQRSRANYFVSQIFQGDPRSSQAFGGTSTRELVDAIILEHEADRLGLPATPEIARGWLNRVTGGSLNDRFFEDIYRRSSLPSQVTDFALLTEIANQVRITEVVGLSQTAEVTPLDVFRAYRDQNEKVSAFAVPVRVEEFIAKVPEPTAAEIAATYEEGKNRLPDPASPFPGFLIPQRVKYEIAAADLNTLAAKIRDSLKIEELREAYKARIQDFPAPPGELPLSIFAGAPDLTPHDAFPEVKDRVASILSLEKAREEIDAKFDAIKNDTMRAFAERYYADEENEDKDKTKVRAEKPKSGDLLRTTTLREGLTYEVTPLVSSTSPDSLGPIKDARTGTTASGTLPRFGDLAFSPKTKLYESLELADRDDRRYLAWKVEDEPSRVPLLDEVKADVVHAWKLAKARPLAEAEAKLIADAAGKAGGGEKIRTVAGTRPVVVTEPRSRLTPVPASFEMPVGRSRPSEITELPLSGEKLRQALFSLEPAKAAVAPNAPEDVFYALSLGERDSTEVAALYDFNRGRFLLDEVMRDANNQRAVDWVKLLREKAGLPADWAPPANERGASDDVADSR